jgi:hypothetical protein
MSEVNINVCNVRELVTASDCGAKVVAFTCRQLSIHCRTYSREVLEYTLVRVDRTII